MKNIFKEQLFNHGILVCEEKKSLTNAFAARYLLDKSFGIRIKEGKSLVSEDMIPFVAEQLGKNVPEPFYKGFPESVRKLAPDELLFDQVMHYLKTYWAKDFSEVGHSQLEEYIERNAFNESYDAKEFAVIPEAEAVNKLAEYVESLLAGTRPLSDDQFEFVCNYIDEYSYEIQNCASKNLAIRLLICLRDIKMADFLCMSDVIKLVDQMNYELYGNDNIKKLNLKNQDRKFITKVINRLFELDKCDIRTCFEKKADWVGLLHHIHYQPIDDNAAQFVQSMRGQGNFSVYAEFEQAMAEKDIQAAVDALKNGKGSGAVLRNLNYIASRCKTEEDLNYVMSKISSDNKIVLLQLLMEYSSYDGNLAMRTFTFSRHNKMVVHKETYEELSSRKSLLTKDVAKMLCVAIYKNLKDTCAGTLGKVYIDEDMKGIALPLQENTSSNGYGVLAKGSRIHIENDKKVRAFTYWEKVNDIDLSLIGIKKDGQQVEFSWRTMWENQSDALTFSGDETSGYNGGSEYFDLDVAKFKAMYPEIDYLVFCNNVYSSKLFSQCVCRAGFMLRDINDSGEIYEPKTVKSSFTIDCDSTFAYLFAIDLMANDFIWLNVARDSFEHVAGATGLSFLTKYFHITDVMNMKKFFTMLASEIVETPEEADVIVSDKNIETNENDGGASTSAEIIRSCDFERIIELMN